MIALVSQTLPQSTQCRRCAGDLNGILVHGEVIRIKFEAVLHDLIFVQAGILQYQNAFFAEHEGNAAGCSQISAELIEIMAHIGSGTVLVVRQALHDNSHAVRAIALVYDGLVIVLVALSGSFLDDTIDVVVGHIVCLCLCDQITQLGICAGVRTALLNANRDLTADLGEDLALSSIRCLFLSLDVIPLRMS